MAHSKKEKYPQIDRFWTKAIEVNVPISFEDLIVNELPTSLEDGDMRKLSVCMDPTHEDSTHVKQNICVFDHPIFFLEVLCARLAIAQGLTGNNITTGPNQYCFARTFLDGEALCIFELKSTELHHKTVAYLILVMNHVVTYFGPKECLSKQKRYICYKMGKSCMLTTRQYMGLVCDLNSRITHMPRHFHDNQQLYGYKLVDPLSNKVQRSHKAMLVSQGFNPETGDLTTFVEQDEQSEIADNIAMAKFSASDEDRDTKKHKKCSRKFKDREDNGKKRRKNSSLYYTFHGERNIHTSRECKSLKARASNKDKPKYGKKDYNKRIKELNFLQAEAAHQNSKYEKLNKYFTKRKTSKKETVILDDYSDSKSSSSTDSDNPSNEIGKTSIAYDSDSSDND